MPLLNLSLSQFLWLFVAANILKKLKPNILFLRWLASRGLSCHKVPEEADLRKLQYKEPGDAKKAGHSRNSKNSRHGDAKSHDSERSELKIKSADLTKLELKQVKLWPWMLQCKPYGDELEWVVDFACMSLISFIFLELLFYHSPKTGEYNASLLWIGLVIAQCLFILLQLTSIYFRNKESFGERSICIASGCIFLLLAMLIMSLDGARLDLGLNRAIQEWLEPSSHEPSSHSLLDPHEIDVPPTTTTTAPSATQDKSATKPAASGTVAIKLLVAVWCSLMGVIFTFPGFRFGQLHESRMGEPGTSLWHRITFNFNYLSPLLAVCLWIPSLSREPLARQDYFVVDDANFELARVGILVLINMLRFSLVRNYTKTFLGSGAERINRLRYRGGTTTAAAVQMTIAGINNYVNVVSLQYVLPTLICLFTAIMYAALALKGAAVAGDAGGGNQIGALRGLFGEQTFVLATERILAGWRALFASGTAKSVAAFATWWSHFAWLCTTTAGVVYHKYFTH